MRPRVASHDERPGFDGKRSEVGRAQGDNVRFRAAFHERDVGAGKDEVRDGADRIALADAERGDDGRRVRYDAARRTINAVHGDGAAVQVEPGGGRAGAVDPLEDDAASLRPGRQAIVGAADDIDSVGEDEVARVIPRRIARIEVNGAAPIIFGVVVGGVDNDVARPACFDGAVAREPAHALKSKRPETNRGCGRSFENPLAAVCGAERRSGERRAAERAAEEVDAGGDGGIGIRRALENSSALTQRKDCRVLVLGFKVWRKRKPRRGRKRAAVDVEATGLAVDYDGWRGERPALDRERIAQQHRVVGYIGHDGGGHTGLDDERVGGNPVVGRRHCRD